MSVVPYRRPESRGLRQNGLATFCGSLVVGVMVGAAHAQAPPARQDAPRDNSRRVSKEDLRYDGRSFHEWEWQLLTELQPKRQLEAIEALRAFGQKGYEHEVVAALDRVLDTEDNRVRAQAMQSLAKIGAASVPVLVKILGSGNPAMRQNAADALQTVGVATEAAIEALEQATRDDLQHVRVAAAGALATLAATQDRLGPLFECLADSDDFDMRRAVVFGLARSWQGGTELQPLFLRALADDRWEVRRTAGGALIKSAPASPEVTEGLRRLVRDDLMHYRLRHNIDQMAGHVALALAREENNLDTVGPALIDAASIVFQDSQFYAGWGGFNEMMPALRRLGPKAADAVPALVQLIDVDSVRVKDEHLASAMDVLRSIGPAARGAVPALRVWAAPVPQNADRDWETLRNHALKALVRITHDVPSGPSE
ncbi:MAG TPA: HEAT repeat domain-containing protein [Pirellulales bacterium]|nr:HEAT repeat domain-containing protein [Pirellulales bacterium]